MSRSEELIQYARSWLELGVSVVPAEPLSKACHVHWREYESRQPTDKELIKWFDDGFANMAIVCGTGGVLVLDFDDLNNFYKFTFRARNLIQTYTEYSAHGVHLFYKVNEPVTKRFAECEALGLGHLCMVAPSIHPSGVVYASATRNYQSIKPLKTETIFSLLSINKLDTNIVNAGKQVSPLTNDGLIGKIKVAYNLLDYVNSITFVKPSGPGRRWWLGRCPLHEDHSPSMWIDTERGTWGCYSPDCPGHRGGDVINLFAMVNNLTVKEAIRTLARMVNL